MGGSQQSKNVTHEMKIYTGDKKGTDCGPAVGSGAVEGMREYAHILTSN